ncbi:uncharacterized protein JCM6883_001182 [Sporobolomyces salmoneus]|uniref:uncharacterized protein n=1 Tax=Sporobolomyces salmoneus TaxID=183962 RepID=UPI00317A303B
MKTLRFEPWEISHPQVRIDDYFGAIEKHPPELTPPTQEARTLYTEGDVSDSFLVNVLNPVRTALASMLNPKYRKHLLIEISNQAAFAEERSGELSTSDTLKKNTGLTSSPAVASFMDHVLMLVENSQKDAANPSIRIPLVVRAGLVFGQDWSHKSLVKRTSDARVLLNQLFLYCKRTDQGRFVLTDYLETLLFRLYPQEIDNNPKRVIRLAMRECSSRVHDDNDNQDAPDPTKRGLRHSICYEGFQALFELGIANSWLLPPGTQQPAVSHPRLRNLIPPPAT